MPPAGLEVMLSEPESPLTYPTGFEAPASYKERAFPFPGNIEGCESGDATYG
jgi:hypothetical protein